MGGMSMCRIDTETGLFFLEELDVNDFVSRLVLSINSLYNLCSFTWELVYLGKSPSSKMVYVEQKMIFPWV